VLYLVKIWRCLHVHYIYSLKSLINAKDNLLRVCVFQHLENLYLALSM